MPQDCARYAKTEPNSRGNSPEEAKGKTTGKMISTRAALPFYLVLGYSVNE